MRGENDNYRRFLRTAFGQHGVIAIGQGGLTARVARYQAQTGRLHRIHRGVYALVPREMLSRDGLYMAAVLACDAVLSHRSAAALHGLRQHGTTHVEVTVAGRTEREHHGVHAYRSSTLSPADTTRLNGIPCTTVARTLIDLAAVTNRRQLERAFDQAEILELFDRRAIDDQLARHPNRRGAPTVKAILAEHDIGATPTFNDFEEAFLALVRSLGLPDPEVNAYIALAGGGPPICADFVWRDCRVVVETDGRRTHATRQAFEADRRRDQRLTAAGWRPIRTTWLQLTRRPLELAQVLRQVVARG